MVYRISFFFLLTVQLSACQKNKLPEPIPIEIKKHYLHLSHTKTENNNIVDSQIINISYEKYDMLWLGGDLSKFTSIDDQMMATYDDLFNFASPNTLWSIGNHDYNDLSRISSFTQRPIFYTYSTNDICFLVFDTQDDLSSISGEQLALFNQVVDTIEQSSHLVILHHKLIWMDGETTLEDMIPTTSNGEQGSCFHCINPNNFYTAIYPRLIEVKNKGIEVLCIGGDIGFYADEFEWTTPEDIHFLASGIYSGFPGNKAIVFEHSLIENTLEWKFELLSNIVK